MEQTRNAQYQIKIASKAIICTALVLLTSCASHVDHSLPEILMKHKQGGYFTAKEYLEWKEKNETTR